MCGRPTWLSCLDGKGQKCHAQSLGNSVMLRLPEWHCQRRRIFNFDIVMNVLRVQTGLYALLCVSYSFA